VRVSGNWLARRCDTAGVRRCRVVPASAVKPDGVSISAATMAMTAEDTVAPGAGVGVVGVVRTNTSGCQRLGVPARSLCSDGRRGVCGTTAPLHGQVRLIADWSTYQPLPWRPSHAVVLANLCEAGAASTPAWSLCPRATLDRLCQELLLTKGAELRCGFESEFMLMRPPPPGSPPDAAPEPVDQVGGTRVLVPNSCQG
jgi:glutamine synthetase